jgi:hypothetical protein
MTRMAWMTPAVFLGAVLMMPQAAHAKDQKPDAVEGKCNENGGVYWPPKNGHSYGCLNPDGSGIVCGGSKKGCDSWPANRSLGSRPKRAQELGMPEKPQRSMPENPPNKKS